MIFSSSGKGLRKLPLHERRKRLEGLLSGNDVVRFSSNVEGAKGAALFRRARAAGSACRMAVTLQEVRPSPWRRRSGVFQSSSDAAPWFR